MVWKGEKKKGTHLQQNCCNVSDYQLGPALKKNPYISHIQKFTFAFDKIIIESTTTTKLHLGRSEVEQAEQKKVRFIFIFVR